MTLPASFHARYDLLRDLTQDSRSEPLPRRADATAAAYQDALAALWDSAPDTAEAMHEHVSALRFDLMTTRIALLDKRLLDQRNTAAIDRLQAENARLRTVIANLLGARSLT